MRKWPRRLVRPLKGETRLIGGPIRRVAGQPVLRHEGGKGVGGEAEKKGSALHRCLRFDWRV